MYLPFRRVSCLFFSSKKLRSLITAPCFPDFTLLSRARGMKICPIFLPPAISHPASTHRPSPSARRFYGFSVFSRKNVFAEQKLHSIPFFSSANSNFFTTNSTVPQQHYFEWSLRNKVFLLFSLICFDRTKNQVHLFCTRIRVPTYKIHSNLFRLIINKRVI